MHFDNLKDKCEYFRSLADYRLAPNGYVIAMLDGRSFSKLIKNNYSKPFDNRFISYMNQVAEYLCKNVQGAKFAYVQSDEISILITDFENPASDSAFGYRLCKLQSLLASMAAGRFNQLVALDLVKKEEELKEDVPFHVQISDAVANMKLAEFDCKVWNVPDYNTAFCHFLWRQNDCVRNSKQQAAQTFFPHKELIRLNADEQIALLNEKRGIDWNTEYNDGEKYGRLVYKEEVEVQRTLYEGGQVYPVNFMRSVWKSHFATPFSNEENIIRTLIPKRNE